MYSLLYMVPRRCMFNLNVCQQTDVYSTYCALCKAYILQAGVLAGAWHSLLRSAWLRLPVRPPSTS